MTADGLLTAGAVGLVFALGAAALGGTTFIVIAGLVGLVVGLALHRTGMRLMVSLALVAAGVVGIVIGKSIVDALCLPGTCTAMSWVAAVLTAIGALIGVGLVVALATRSFEEHRAALDRQRQAAHPHTEDLDQ